MAEQEPSEIEPGRNRLTPENGSAREKKIGRKLLRAALFFAGSAACGGLAVALWDRKTLATMHRKAAETSEPPGPGADIY
jgi:hypothetical protein